MKLGPGIDECIDLLKSIKVFCIEDLSSYNAMCAAGKEASKSIYSDAIYSTRFLKAIIETRVSSMRNMIDFCDAVCEYNKNSVLSDKLKCGDKPARDMLDEVNALLYLLYERQPVATS